MCLFGCSNVKSVHVVEKDEETCVYVLGVYDIKHVEVSKWGDVMVWV